MSTRRWAQSKWSGCLVTVAAVVAILALGAIDYHTGPELDFGVFYLVPVALAAWLGSRRQALLAAVLGGVVWAHADVLGDLSPSVMWWRSLAGLGTNALVAFSLRRLRAAMTQRQQMLRYVVHDLRTPLTSLIASLGTLRMTASAHQPCDVELLDASLASARRLLTMVNSMLDLAQVQAGQLRLRLAPVLAADLATAAEVDLRPWASTAEVTLALPVSAPEAWVLADRELTVRVLTNLAANALKYSPRQGQVAVDWWVEPGRVVFAVSDQGPGIPEAWRERIFEPFAQVDGAGRPAGSGLGLTFARQAVQAQGGRIWVAEPRLGGSTLCFSLPAVAGPGATVAGPGGPA